MNSLYDSEVKRLGKITAKEEIELLLEKLETELTNLPFGGPEQRRHYKFGQYLTGMKESVNKANRTFRELQKKATDLLDSLDVNTNVKEK